MLLRATGVDVERREFLDILEYLHSESVIILLYMISRCDLIVAHRISIEKRHAASFRQALSSLSQCLISFFRKVIPADTKRLRTIQLGKCLAMRT
jgi:hypothetical protein